MAALYFAFTSPQGQNMGTYFQKFRAEQFIIPQIKIRQRILIGSVTAAINFFPVLRYYYLFDITKAQNAHSFIHSYTDILPVLTCLVLLFGQLGKPCRK